MTEVRQLITQTVYRSPEQALHLTWSHTCLGKPPQLPHKPDTKVTFNHPPHRHITLLQSKPMHRAERSTGDHTDPAHMLR